MNNIKTTNFVKIELMATRNRSSLPELYAIKGTQEYCVNQNLVVFLDLQTSDENHQLLMIKYRYPKWID